MNLFLPSGLRARRLPPACSGTIDVAYPPCPVAASEHGNTEQRRERGRAVDRGACTALVLSLRGAGASVAHYVESPHGKY